MNIIQKHISKRTKKLIRINKCLNSLVGTDKHSTSYYACKKAGNIQVKAWNKGTIPYIIKKPVVKITFEPYIYHIE